MKIEEKAEQLKKIGLIIKDQKISQVCFAIRVEWNQDKNIENPKNELMNYALDMSDWLKSKGAILPGVIIMHAKEKKDEWEKIAGDQDWHRGDFSIIVKSNEDEAKKIFEDVIGDGIKAEDYKLEPMSEQKYVEYLRGENRELKEQFYPELLNIIADEIEKNGINAFENGISKWKKLVEEKLESTNSFSVERKES